MTRSRAIPADEDIIRLTKHDIQVLGIDPSLLPSGYALLLRKDAKGIILRGDLRLANTHIGDKHVVLQYLDVLSGIPSSELRHRYFNLQSKHALCTELWSRDALSSGFLSERTADIFSKDDCFKLLVDAIRRQEEEKSLVPLTQLILWTVINLDGSHPFHHDKFKKGYNYRNLISFFGGRKRMWFLCKETGGMFGVEIPHNAHVTLDKVGGGVIGNVDHCVELAANTILVAFESK
jgi:hypothetical protein